jgi:hypothetical protein
VTTRIAGTVIVLLLFVPMGGLLIFVSWRGVGTPKTALAVAGLMRALAGVLVALSIWFSRWWAAVALIFLALEWAARTWGRKHLD